MIGHGVQNLRLPTGFGRGQPSGRIVLEQFATPFGQVLVHGGGERALEFFKDREAGPAVLDRPFELAQIVITHTEIAKLPAFVCAGTGLARDTHGLLVAFDGLLCLRYLPIKMRTIDTRAKMVYGHSTLLRREVNDRTRRDPNLPGGNIGRGVGWCASASACSRVETAAEKVADETKSMTKA